MSARAESARDQAERIYGSTTMTPEQKRDRWNRVLERMVNTARQALGKPDLPSRF